jgi:L-lactate dehydrogenase
MGDVARIAIIGGAGRVGSTVGFALQTAGLGREIILLDVAEDQVRGEALDLRHGAAFAAPQRIAVGTYSDAAAADLVIAAAGLRRRPGESRLALAGRNVELFQGILGQLRQAGLSEQAILIVVTNPVDVLTYLAAASGVLPPSRVIGTGTLLDTLRFRSLLAEGAHCDPRQIDAMVVGEHGDSMVPLWSSATVNGVPLDAVPGMDLGSREAAFSATRGAGNEINTLKGGSGFAIALAVRELVAAIIGDSRAILPLSTLQDGAYGLRDVALSVPTVVGREGAIKRLEVPLSTEERKALEASAATLKETLARVAAGSGDEPQMGRAEG